MSTRALQFDILLLGFRDPDTDAPLAFGVVNFLSAGTSNPLTVWDTKEKTGAKNSVTLDVNGQAQVYGDGVYKLEVLAVDTSAVSYSPMDNIKIRAVSTNVVETNTTYTATTDDDLILCDTSGGAVLINLYPAADFISGLTVKNISAAGNDVTVDADGSELIDGATTDTLTDGQTQEYFSNGSGWFGSGQTTGTTFTSTSLIPDATLTFTENAGITTVSVVDPVASATKVGVLNVKIVEIGTWDMNLTASRTVLHGVDQSKIRQVSAQIREDSGDFSYPLNTVETTTPDGAVFAVLATTVQLNRVASGWFASPDFSDDSGIGNNRGWVTIWYVD